VNGVRLTTKPTIQVTAGKTGGPRLTIQVDKRRPPYPAAQT
jgi:hypothetical protein